jgi:hypothetical protein
MEFYLETYDAKSQVENFLRINIVRKSGQFYAAELSIKCALTYGPNIYVSSNRYIFFTELVEDNYKVFYRTPLN